MSQTNTPLLKPGLLFARVTVNGVLPIITSLFYLCVFVFGVRQYRDASNTSVPSALIDAILAFVTIPLCLLVWFEGGYLWSALGRHGADTVDRKIRHRSPDWSQSGLAQIVSAYYYTQQYPMQPLETASEPPSNEEDERRVQKEHDEEHRRQWMMVYRDGMAVVSGIHLVSKNLPLAICFGRLLLQLAWKDGLILAGFIASIISISIHVIDQFPSLFTLARAVSDESDQDAPPPYTPTPTQLQVEQTLARIRPSLMDTWILSLQHPIPPPSSAPSAHETPPTNPSADERLPAYSEAT